MDCSGSIYVLEKTLQQKVIQICKQHAILAVKVDSSSQRGWPDLTLLLPNGIVLFVELKTPTGRLSKLQEHTHRRMKENNGNVHTIRDIDSFKSLIAQFT